MPLLKIAPWVLGGIVALVICRPAHADPNFFDTKITATGQCAESRVPPGTPWQDARPRPPALFGCWNAASNNIEGSLSSDFFVASSLLDLYVAGFPNRAGVQLYLEKTDGTRLSLRTRMDPGPVWLLRSWKLDSSWTGQRVRLKIEDRVSSVPNGWVAISLPMRGSYPLVRSVARTVALVGDLWLMALLLFAPGVAVSSALRTHLALEGTESATVALVAMGLTGYLSFWLYFWHARIGRLCACAFVVAAIAYLLWKRPWKYWRAFRLPFLFTMLAAGAYCCLDRLFPFEAPDPNLATERRFFVNELPPDNVLPFLVESRLYAGVSLRPGLLSGWHTSDRPPLQSGLTVLTRPFAPSLTPGTHYQLAGIVLQCTCLFSLWIFLASMGFGARQTIPALGFVIFSPFCFLHGVYVWPKLLAASYVLLGLSLLLPSQRRRPILTGLCFALGLLSHTGAGLTLIGLPLLLWLGRRVSYKTLALAVGSALLLLLPWFLFQRLYDPPGDRLFRANFAGDMYAPGSLPQALLAAYRKISLEEFALRRLLDLRILFVANLPLMLRTDLVGRVDSFLNEQFFALFPAIGLVNVGLLLRLSPKWRRVADPSRYRNVDRFLLCVALSLAAWILMMFDPAATLVHQGSLANVVILMAGFALYLSAVFPRGVYLVLALQALIVFPFYAVSKRFLEQLPGTLFDARLDPANLLLSIALCGAIVYTGAREIGVKTVS